MRNVVNGFRDFIMRGNVVELAVAVVIGAAFGAVVDSVVKHLINPIVGAIFGQPNLDHLWALTLRHGTEPVEVGYILTALLNFLIVAAAIYFLIVLPMNAISARRNRNKVDEPEAAPADIALLTEIRDLLAQRRP